MAQIRRPSLNLPPAPEKYDQREQNEFRRIIMQALSESVEDLVRPSLVVSVAQTATVYTITVTWTGTMTYTIDGAASVAGTTSPQVFAVTRNAFLGAAKVYVFTVVNNEQTTSNTVSVPSVDTNVAGSLSLPAQTANAGTNVYSYSWTTAGQPSGTTYNVVYKFTNTARTLVEEGTVTSATSGGTIISTGTIGANPTYVTTVNAINAGQVIMTATRTGTFVT